MNSIIINIENLKCHGCANTITKGLNKIEAVKSVSVDVPASSVNISFDGGDENIETIKAKLSGMGYPESGHNSAVSVAKSFVSCAVGRVTK